MATQSEYCIQLVNICLSSSEWAGWVQAVGSIAAIVGSVYLVERQHRLSLRADKKRGDDDVIRKTKNLLADTMTAVNYIESACEYAEAGHHDASMDITHEKLVRVQASFEISPFDFPDDRVSRAVSSLKIALGRAISGLGQWSQGPGLQAESGIRDLQTARRISREALTELLAIASGTEASNR